MPRLLPVCAALLVLGASALGGVARALDPEYYPHAAGRAWVYSSGETQVAGAAVTYRGVRVVPVNHQFGQALVRQDLMEYRADGSVWLRGVNAGGQLGWYAAPLNVYPPGPLRVGQTWQTGSAQSRVVGTAGVKTALGTYNALVISTSAAGARPQLTYFVPSLGVVRYQTADGNVTDLVKGR